MPIIKADTMEAGVGAGPIKKQALRQRIYAAIFLSDAVALICGFNLSGWARFGSLIEPQVLIIISVTLPIFMIFNFCTMSSAVLADWRNGLFRALVSLLGAMAVVLFVSFYLKTSTEVSRLLMMGGFVGTGMLIAGDRYIAGRIAQRVLGNEAVSKLLIVEGIDLMTPVGTHRLDSDIVQLDGDLSEPFTLDRLAQCIDGFDSVTVACAPERREAWAIALRSANIRAHLLLPELGYIGALGHERLETGLKILVSRGPLRSRDVALKRGLDLLLAISALAFLGPLMVLVALAIKHDSQGPVFFTQRRVGHSNRMFSVYKFRSMTHATTDLDGVVSASRTDPRVTRVGAFIRKTSVDELPQIINILRGEMSFVGPRPHALGSLAGNELFWRVDNRYWQRHQTKPGLTGLAQVRGYRGATPHRDDLINRLQADLEYLQNWNVLRDIAILIGTLRVLVHKNAY